ncbi:MAG: outer membrane beta-barrel protein, partial [Cyclobacteriaceae bacterium]
VQPPNLEQLQPVVDNTNPVIIYNGNPTLDTEYAHQLNLNYSLFDQFSLTGIFFRGNINYVKNKITNQTIIDDLLRQVVTPVNVDNELTVNGNLSFSTPVRWMKAKVSLNLSGLYNRGILFVNNSGNIVERTSHTADLKLENRNKKLVDIGVGVRVSGNKTNYLNESVSDQVFLQQSIYAAADIYVRKKWTIGANFNRDFYNGQSFDDNLSFPLLTASLSRTFLKLDRAELKLSVFDVLNTNQGISRNSNFNFIEEEQVNVLNRYFLVSFRYKISKFNS